MEDANSKLVGVVAFADVDIEESVDDRSVTADSLATPSQFRQPTCWEKTFLKSGGDPV